jgi:hypothetical protein
MARECEVEHVNLLLFAVLALTVHAPRDHTRMRGEGQVAGGGLAWRFSRRCLRLRPVAVDGCSRAEIRENFSCLAGLHL